jgi:hypothetical protein
MYVSMWLVTLVVLVPMFALLAWLYLWRRTAFRDRRNPLSRGLLRSTGRYIQQQIDELDEDISSALLFVVVGPLMLYAMVLTYWIERGRPPAPYVTVFLISMTVVALGVAFWKFSRLIRRKHQLMLGLEAEIATAEELQQLAREGYWIFNDVPAEKSNIDHVVIGPNGIFSLETKGRSKPVKSKTGDEWRVVYDGETLRFPGWSEKKPLEQSVRQANWLRKWLSSATGEDVAVHPLLVLPGWYVDRKSGKGISVVNSREVTAAISKRRNAVQQSPKLIHQVVHQLDQRCRDVSLRAYRPLE